jgi:DNA repair exonuclease SbcCD ATPase subunit
LARRAREALERFRATASAGVWAQHIAGARSRYEELKRQLTAAGAGDPSEYGRLVQEQQNVESRLRAIDARRDMAHRFERQAAAHLERLGRLRDELTSRRKRFLAEILGGNDRVQVDVVPYGDRYDAEKRFREHISRTEQTFQDQIWSDDDKRGVLRELYVQQPPTQDPIAFARGLAALKARLTGIARGGDSGDLHGKFVAHLRRLPPEALDRIAALFPGDAVTVAYRTRGGEDFRPISQGSPGQKSAAVLAFVLSHGTEPLILDQPEDDLDNQLIAELIVTQLRQAKARRQILVVTHNPNLVVNGDAELILPFVARSGQTRVEGAGGLQEDTVRETICSVMEGGREALDRRYRRIRGGGSRV